MRKTILGVMFVVGAMNISNSQTNISSVYSCVNEHFTNLTQCFTSNDVTGTYRGSGSVLYFQPDVGITYNQVGICVENYNKDRVTCPTAPLLVIGNGEKKKKLVL